MSRVVFASLLLAACGHGDPVETAIVAPLQTPCVGESTQLCLLITPAGEDQRREFGGIVGFTHEWGVETEILMKTEIIEDPPADGSSEQLVLVEVVAENDIPVDPFTLEFPNGPGGWFSGTGTELDLSGTAIECELAVCDQLRAADQRAEPFSATFELVGPQALRAIAVTP